MLENEVERMFGNGMLREACNKRLKIKFKLNKQEKMKTWMIKEFLDICKVYICCQQCNKAKYRLDMSKRGRKRKYVLRS